MKSDKIETFMKLAAQSYSSRFTTGSLEERKLGAQLLLSEVLEYVVSGLGIIPEFNGTPITEPNNLEYSDAGKDADKKEMLDGLADVAYTMYWNSVKFGIPLEEAFELVCDNNLSKFVEVTADNFTEGKVTQGLMSKEHWRLNKDVSWPDSVKTVEIVQVEMNGEKAYYAVGKDESGKVRKPSTYSSVELDELIKAS